MDSVFNRYPQLKTLRGLVPEVLVEREINSRAEEFENYIMLAREKIKTVKLRDVFPFELEKGTIILENFFGHWGNITVEEVCKICLITKFFKPKRVFEFGTYNGMTTLQLALNSPDDCKIFTIDLPPDSANKTKHKLSEIDRFVTDEFLKKFNGYVGSYFKAHARGKKITQILSDSATYDYSRFFRTMDIIFIDAAHDYANKKSDSENALKMLAPNGIILWDNYDDVTNPDVTKYLYELSEQLPLYHLRGTMLVVHWNKQ